MLGFCPSPLVKDEGDSAVLTLAIRMRFRWSSEYMFLSEDPQTYEDVSKTSSCQEDCGLGAIPDQMRI